MPHPTITEHALLCEQCPVLVTVWVDLDDWLDGTVRVRCPSHRTATSAP